MVGSSTHARTLFVTSPLMAGPDVKGIQQRLVALHYKPGAPDGIYGHSTEMAVRAFQADHKLAVDGAVGPLTAIALAGAHAKTAPPVPKPGSSPGLLALAEAIKHLDEKEDPAGSNRQPFGKWFQMDGVPWCNIFVSYCFEVAAGITLCHGYPGSGVTSKGCAYVPTTEAWLRATNQWLGRITPAPGEIAIYNWDGGVPDHIGIVETVTSATTFTAIEGNTSAASNANGGQVERRERTLTDVDGFGRIR